MVVIDDDTNTFRTDIACQVSLAHAVRVIAVSGVKKITGARLPATVIYFIFPIRETF